MRVRRGAGRLASVAGAFLLNFIQFLLWALWALIFGRMIVSWVDPTGRNQVSAFLIQTTEPILGPVAGCSRRPAWSTGPGSSF